MRHDTDHARRALLRWMAASPLLAGLPRAFAQESTIASAADALDVFDFEAAARRIVPPAHWGYLQSGVDGDVTVRRNSEAYARWQLRARRFVDVGRLNLATTVFGTAAGSPVMLSPIGSLGAMHPGAEVEVARAAATRRQIQVVSTGATARIEDIVAARGGPVWFQLYTTNRPGAMRQLLRRAEGAGCPVVAVTVDTPAGRNTVTATRLRRGDTRPCSACHAVDARGNPRLDLSKKPMFAGIDTEGLGYTLPDLTWDFIGRLKDQTSMKVVIKGVESGEDARLAVRHGADGIYVSNHGGRALESGRGTIESLAEVVQGAGGKVPVLIDGGVRRGTDVYKALALGASAVGIGRPYVWGLASFGQAGVERVIDILNLELRLAMAGCGANTPAEIRRDSIIEAAVPVTR